MISKFAGSLIDSHAYGRAEKAEDQDTRDQFLKEAFGLFDRFGNALNHVFEQFAVNSLLTRNGLVPRQDDKITDQIYTPTLSALAAPKWRSVSDDLTRMFEDYRNQKYAEVITKAHSALQRFLQVLAGTEGKNAKGELGRLFAIAKQDGILSGDRFTESMLSVIQGFVSSERAVNSTAKPAVAETTSSDALLVMNVVMILMQHCLQHLEDR